MRPETKEYWTRVVTKLVDAVGVDEARVICNEVMDRVGDGGTTREYTVALLKVASERGAAALSWLGKP